MIYTTKDIINGFPDDVNIGSTVQCRGKEAHRYIGHLQRTSSARGGGGRCQTFSYFFFPCSADHERDWPPCKVVFFGLATNALNVRNNNNNNIVVTKRYQGQRVCDTGGSLFLPKCMYVQGLRTRGPGGPPSSVESARRCLCLN